MRHYRQLASGGLRSDVIQCPFGFASAPFNVGGAKAAVTGFIPYPRHGGNQERILAKRHKETHFSVDAVKRVISGLIATHEHLLEVEQEIVRAHSMALHEIRKFNRTIKQNAERLCKQASPDNVDHAPKEMLNIYKTAELMSNEYDVIEILADASQATLPVNTVSEIYKMFDKCVKIYNAVAGGRKIILRASGNYSPRVAASDKTLHIIPSVLIENALKYSLPGSDIRINIDPDETDGQRCIVTVTNDSPGNQELDDRVFQRGVRFSSTGDGSGNGLYVAQLIANQHKTRITINSKVLNPTTVRHTFVVPFRTTNERYLRKR